MPVHFPIESLWSIRAAWVAVLISGSSVWLCPTQVSVHSSNPCTTDKFFSSRNYLSFLPTPALDSIALLITRLVSFSTVLIWHDLFVSLVIRLVPCWQLNYLLFQRPAQEWGGWRWFDIKSERLLRDNKRTPVPPTDTYVPASTSTLPTNLDIDLDRPNNFNFVWWVQKNFNLWGSISPLSFVIWSIGVWGKEGEKEADSCSLSLSPALLQLFLLLFQPVGGNHPLSSKSSKSLPSKSSKSPTLSHKWREDIKTHVCINFAWFFLTSCFWKLFLRQRFSNGDYGLIKVLVSSQRCWLGDTAV